jgi:hypothetical protein
MTNGARDLSEDDVYRLAALALFATAARSGREGWILA